MKPGFPAASLIDKINYDPTTGCWNWKGSLTKTHQYPRVRFKNRTVLVHRLSAHLWLKFNLNSPLDVCHHCDNPACFNPKHLFIGTRSDNMQDARKKDRLRFWNKQKTHCKRGHLLTGDNIWVRTSASGYPSRHCKQCQYILHARRYLPGGCRYKGDS